MFFLKIKQLSLFKYCEKLKMLRKIKKININK